MERVHLLISGQVQGVGFRYAAAAFARELEVSGWVKNLPDGRVEIEVIGEGEPFETFLDWCKQGPPNCKVKSVEIASRESVPKPAHPRFEIK